jgi:hypothetical protein
VITTAKQLLAERLPSIRELPLCIIVPKPRSAPPLEPTESATPHPEDSAVPKQETESAQIVEFPKVA